MKIWHLQSINYHGKFRLDDGFGELCRDDIGGLGFDFPDAWKSEAFHSTSERTEIWRKQERQHVDSPVRQIHSCAPGKVTVSIYLHLNPFKIWKNWSLNYVKNKRCLILISCLLEASLSIAVFGLTKWETSAMWTPTSQLPFSNTRECRASSISVQPGGSTENCTDSFLTIGYSTNTTCHGIN